MVCMVASDFTSAGSAVDFHITLAKNFLKFFNCLFITFSLVIQNAFIHIDLFQNLIVFSLEYFLCQNLHVFHL